jgi:hypothetical protein
LRRDHAASEDLEPSEGVQVVVFPSTTRSRREYNLFDSWGIYQARDWYRYSQTPNSLGRTFRLDLCSSSVPQLGFGTESSSLIPIRASLELHGQASSSHQHEACSAIELPRISLVKKKLVLAIKGSLVKK